MDQPAASNHGDELQNLNSDDSPTQISNQGANGDGSTSTYMDADVYTAAAKGDIEVLMEISESEFQVQLNPKHNTILHIASEFGETQCVNWILGLPSCSSRLERPNLKGDTPLHLAAREGKLEVVTALLEAAKKLPVDIETGVGVDKQMLLSLTNEGKNTALHEAVRFNHSDVVALLIEEDPDFIYGANDSGTTPLYMAAERGFTDLVKLIIDKSTTPPSYNGLMGRTALHAAVICHDIEMTMMILEWNPNLTKEVDKNGWSPLHYAAEEGCDIQIVKLLLEKSEKSIAYLRNKDENRTALHIASFHHHTKIVEEILSHFPGCREQVDDKGNNVFHFAMMKKGDDNFKLSDYFENVWLQDRQLVNEKDAQGNTPLHRLSSNQILDEEFILQPRVDRKASNSKGLMASDLISRDDFCRKKDKILKLLTLEKTMKKKNNSSTEVVMPDSRLLALEKKSSETIDDNQCKVESKGEKYISTLKKRGEAHLIVSALITTVTFAAGFTLPGGYKEDEGMVLLTKKTAFRAFVATDTIAMVFSASAVFFHFLMTMHNEEDVVKKHLVWALRLTMLGMGAMVIAFVTGLYAVLPHSSALSIFACILCSCFFLSFFYELKQIWKSSRE